MGTRTVERAPSAPTTTRARRTWPLSKNTLVSLLSSELGLIDTTLNGLWTEMPRSCVVWLRIFSVTCCGTPRI